MDLMQNLVDRRAELHRDLGSSVAKTNEIRARLEEVDDVIALVQKIGPAPAADRVPRRPRGEVEALVLKELRSGTSFGASLDDVVAATGVKRNSVASCLARMQKTGTVVLSEKGYVLTEYTNLKGSGNGAHGDTVSRV